jgi:hypothetical protein
LTFLESSIDFTLPQYPIARLINKTRRKVIQSAHPI